MPDDYSITQEGISVVDQGDIVLITDDNTYRSRGEILFKDTYPRVEYNSFINNGLKVVSY